MRVALALATALLLGCRSTSAPPPAAAAPPARVFEVTPDLQVKELAPGVWLHTSWQKLASGQRFPSNGLLVRDKDSLWLVDTAWGEASTEALLRWTKETLRLPLAGAVVTHWHDDRLGGGAILLREKVPLYAGPLTRGIAEAKGLPLPRAVAELAEVGGSVRLGPLEVFFPGPAHTRDNVVAWIAASKVLVGGCAVRAAATKDLGNVADADVPAWPESIRRVKARYGQAVVVVPGHGATGGPELLDHTLTLFTAAP